MIRTLATRKSDKIPFPPSNSLPKAAVSLALKILWNSNLFKFHYATALYNTSLSKFCYANDLSRNNSCLSKFCYAMTSLYDNTG
ncbi:hypothetical protein A2U01_0008340 [Trifolium medium]|uniref:Uncharacterized protein n=1 Tax=Trifolium medium TaxID=97028 RepID=A0A392MIY4_9FABA|nr:hypothetical protein [Trifolium medium]